MDASHIVVGVLTAVTLALLIWIEMRSRRQHAAGKAAESAGSAGVPQDKGKI